MNKGWFKKGHTINNDRKGNKSGNWEGGKTKNSQGYVLVYKPEHPYALNGKYVRAHHLEVEKYLGRYLDTLEVVHHIDSNKNNNNINNLIVFKTNGLHRAFHRWNYDKGIVLDGRKYAKN